MRLSIHPKSKPTFENRIFFRVLAHCGEPPTIIVVVIVVIVVLYLRRKDIIFIFNKISDCYLVIYAYASGWVIKYLIFQCMTSTIDVSTNT